MTVMSSSASFGVDACGVSVLIITNRHIDYLVRALRSVEAQDFKGRIHIVVVADNPPWRPSDLASTSRAGVSIESYCVLTEITPFQSTVERVARLRNAALAFVREKYICFLDDDNTWEPNHLSTLYNALLSAKAMAAHSWRRLVDETGDPWIPDRFPWGRDAKRSARLFEQFMAAGIMSADSNIFRDMLGLDVDGEIIDAVDMGAWLFDRRAFDTLRFETEYSEWEIANSITEDDKLLAAIRQTSIPVVTSQAPTLVYSLGGYSNRARSPEQ